VPVEVGAGPVGVDGADHAERGVAFADDEVDLPVPHGVSVPDGGVGAREGVGELDAPVAFGPVAGDGGGGAVGVVEELADEAAGVAERGDDVQVLAGAGDHDVEQVRPGEEPLAPGRVAGGDAERGDDGLGLGALEGVHGAGADAVGADGFEVEALHDGGLDGLGLGAEGREDGESAFAVRDEPGQEAQGAFDFGGEDALLVGGGGFDAVDGDRVGLLDARVRGDGPDPAAVELRGGEPDEVRDAAVVLGQLDHGPGAAREVVEADAAGVEAGLDRLQAMAFEHVVEARVGGEGHELELAGVPGDDGAAGAGEHGGGAQLVDVAGLVDDDEVEGAGAGGQDRFGVGDRADPQGAGAQEGVGVDVLQDAAPLRAVAAEPGGAQFAEGAGGLPGEAVGAAGVGEEGRPDAFGGGLVGLVQVAPQGFEAGAAFGGEPGHGLHVAGDVEGALQSGGVGLGPGEAEQFPLGLPAAPAGPGPAPFAAGGRGGGFDGVEVGVPEPGEVVEEEHGRVEGAQAAALQVEAGLYRPLDASEEVEGVGGLAAQVVAVLRGEGLGDSEPVPLGVAEHERFGPGAAGEDPGEDVGGEDRLRRDEHRLAAGDGVDGDRGERVALPAAGRTGDHGDGRGAGAADGGGLLAVERERGADLAVAGRGGVGGAVHRGERGGVEVRAFGPVVEALADGPGLGAGPGDVDDGTGEHDRLGALGVGPVGDGVDGVPGGGRGREEPGGVGEVAAGALGGEDRGEARRVRGADELGVEDEVAGGDDLVVERLGLGDFEAHGPGDERDGEAAALAVDAVHAGDDAPALAQEPLVAVELVVRGEVGGAGDRGEAAGPGGLLADLVEVRGGRGLVDGGEVGEGGQDAGGVHGGSVRPGDRPVAHERRGVRIVPVGPFRGMGKAPGREVPRGLFNPASCGNAVVPLAGERVLLLDAEDAAGAAELVAQLVVHAGAGRRGALDVGGRPVRGVEGDGLGDGGVGGGVGAVDLVPLGVGAGHAAAGVGGDGGLALGVGLVERLDAEEVVDVAGGDVVDHVPVGPRLAGQVRADLFTAGVVDRLGVGEVAARGGEARVRDDVRDRPERVGAGAVDVEDGRVVAEDLVGQAVAGGGVGHRVDLVAADVGGVSVRAGVLEDAAAGEGDGGGEADAADGEKAADGSEFRVHWLLSVRHRLSGRTVLLSSS
jgi:hypothetical protein